MTGLAIAPDLELPLDLVTEATAIVATRGAGKSSFGAVIVEEAIAAGVPTVVIDWTGVFWGLRSSASGNKAGLGIYVLGGPHHDVPLEAGAAKFIADLVVDSGHSFVLDLSDFTKGQMRHFCADFLDRLYERKARQRTTLLLVIDEAHELAPQSPRGGFKGDAARLIAAMEQVAALGRSRGLGVVMITQRTQALNKAVLDLIETLLVMRMLSPRAVAAVRDWIVVKNEDDEQGVLPSLPKLPTGTAWVWSPLRGILQKVAVRRIRTFDSYATPKPGQVRVEPKARKELDLAELGEQMAATVERAKADDPTVLRTRIRDLEQRLAAIEALEAMPPVEPEVRLVHIPVVTAEVLSDFTSAAVPLTEVLTYIRDELDRLAQLPTKEQSGSDPTKEPGAAARPGRVGNPATQPAPVAGRDGRERGRRDAAGSSTHRSPAGAGYREVTPAGDRPQLKEGARRILETLSEHHPMRVTLAQLGALARFKVSGGAFQAHWRALKGAGLVDVGRDVGISDPGLAYLGIVATNPMTPVEQLARWRQVLKPAATEILDALLEVRPDGLDREALAEQVNMTASGGAFQAHVRTLQRNGLVEVRGPSVYAADGLGAAS